MSIEYGGYLIDDNYRTEYQHMLGSWLLGGLGTCFLHILVGILLFFSTIGSVMVQYIDWIYFVKMRKVPIENFRIFPTQYVIYIIPIFCSLVSQSFFVYRISQVLSGRENLSHKVISSILISSSFVLGFTTFIFAILHHQSYIAEYPNISQNSLDKILPSIWRWSEVIVNLYIFTSSVYIQVFQKREQKKAETLLVKDVSDGPIMKFSKATIHSNTLPLIFVFSDAIIAQTTMNKGNFHLAFFLQLPYIYGISVILILNCRRKEDGECSSKSDQDSDSNPPSGISTHKIIYNFHDPLRPTYFPNSLNPNAFEIQTDKVCEDLWMEL